MYDLTDDEKLKFIIKTSNALGVTAYEYGQNTAISELGARNILSGESKNPRTKNLNIMLQYLESKVVGTKYQQESEPILLKEPVENYNDEDLETIIYKRVYRRLEKKFTDIEKRLTKLEGKK